MPWERAMGFWAEIFNKYALGTVAIISMVVGPYMQWRIAKRQTELQAAIAARQVADNIAGRRQKWIDELRADVAEILTIEARLVDLQVNEPGPDAPEQLTKEYIDKYVAGTDRGHELAQRIWLRLNRNEAPHQQLRAALERVEEVGGTFRRGSSPHESADWKEVRRRAAEITQDILKAEWERVKKGEI